MEDACGSPTDEKGARANAGTCHGSCWRTLRASSRRGSSLTLKYVAPDHHCHRLSRGRLDLVVFRYPIFSAYTSDLRRCRHTSAARRKEAGIQRNRLFGARRLHDDRGVASIAHARDNFEVTASPMKKEPKTSETTHLLAPRFRASGFRSTWRYHSKKTGDCAPRVSHL